MLSAAILNLLLAACTEGTATACTLAACAAAQSVCTGGAQGPCTCAIQTCDDGNVCTTDALVGSPGSYSCTHTPRTGASCSDGDPCNGTETCNSAGACLSSGAPDLNDGNACTYDYCDATGVQHETVATCAPADTGPEVGATPGVAPNPLAQPVPQMPGLPGLEVVENTGEVRYRYAFALPAARGRYQPALWLGYSSSSAQNEGYGHGWTLSTSYIEPSADGPYRLVHGGQAAVLVSIGGGTYRPEIGAAFVSVTPAPNMAGWVAVDPAGNTYTFDAFFGWGSPSGGRWYLRTVVDVDGNKTLFTYQQESGPAALLTEVSYNNYFVAGVETYAHSVALSYVERTRDEPGNAGGKLRWTARVAGGECEFARLLTTVSVRARSTGFANLRSYAVGYTNPWASTPGMPPQVLLTSITPLDATGLRSLPPTTFSYRDPAKPGYALSSTPQTFAAPMAPVVNPTPGWGGPAPAALWIDLDGDGLADRVANASGGGMVWARNTTVRGSPTVTFAPVAFLAGTGPGPGDPGFSLVAPTQVFRSFTPPALVFGRHSELADMNGDGLPDLVQDATAFGATSCAGLLVRLAGFTGGQLGYAAPICFAGPQWVGKFGDETVDLKDLNLDGAADYGPVPPFLSTGTSFAPGSVAYQGSVGSIYPSGTPIVNHPDPMYTPAQCVSPTVDFAAHPEAICQYSGDPRAATVQADLDGDGHPDTVTREAGGSWVVLWGTGAGSYVKAPIARPAGLLDHQAFPSSSPDRDAVGCECDYYDARSGWQTTGASIPVDFWGWDAGFVDLNGDGVADYVTNVTTFDTAPADGTPDTKTGTWTVYLGELPPALLRSVTTGAGATASLGYAPASAFQAGPRQGVPWVATSVTVSGPRMPSATSYFWYDQPRGGQTWYLPLKYEPRGFARTLAYDGAAQVVRETTWATGSHAFVGSPTRVSWATQPQAITTYDPAQPPTGFTEFRRVELSLAAKVGGRSDCADSAAEPAAYPVIPVTTLQKASAWIGATAFSSQRSVACADVDDSGNTLRAAVDPDTAVAGDEVYELAAFDPIASCKVCPVWTTTSKDAAGSSASWLAHSEYLYDAPGGSWSQARPLGQAGIGRLAYVRRYSSATTYEVASATVYGAYGTVASRVMDPYPGAHSLSWTEAYTYDAQRLRVTRTRVSDAGVALVKDATYDALGQLVLEQGPYVEGWTGAKATRAYAYDGFGRALAVGRSVSGTQMTGTIAAAEYVDASPPTVKSYTFLAPLTITIGSVPVRPDVKQVVTHVDGLGRALEVRERLGVAGTLDAAAKITQVLAGYRVTRSVKYDAAGRAVASLEPQLRPNTPTLSTEAYEGFDVLAATATARGALTLFDAQGRISCSMAGVWAAVAATGTGCTSSLGDDAQFRVATHFVYGTATQYGRAMATARANAPTSTNQVSGTTVYYRADGLVATTYDFYGNAAELTYDLLGRPTALTRTARAKAASAQTTTKGYDLLGRVVEEWDANWSPGSGPTGSPTPGPTANPKPTASRLYEYDGAGRISRVRLPFDPAAMTRAELRYEYKSLGRRTKAYALEPSLVAGGVSFTQRALADVAYDSPYTGSAAYGYVAGRVASIASPLTTLAMGYDQNGRTTRRDQWFTGLTGAFSATGNFSDDGRLLTAGFTSGYSSSASWQGSYDSAGRPVKVGLTAPTAFATALWEAPLAGGASPYDRLDRIGSVKSNGGLVTTARSYSAYTGQLTAHGVSTATAQVYGVDTVVYLATKLRHFRDTVSASTYGFTYDANGRLATATASGGTGALAQGYGHGYLFSDAASSAGATAGNLERVTEGSAITHYDYAQDRVASTSNSEGATANKFIHDHAGRLTSKQTSTGTETEGFAYDVQDQLRQVRRGGLVTEKLEYDPTGAPLFRTVGAQAIYYVGPFATVTATMNAGCTGYGCPVGTGTGTIGGVKVSAHVLLAGSRIASVRASNVLYYHRDRQGSVVATTYTDGNIGARYRYTPYGALDKVEGADALNGSELGYTGGLRLGWHPETGARQGDLLLLGARVYDAGLKRWLQADTVDAKRYTYTDGDPVNLVDPTGREALNGPGGGAQTAGSSASQVSITYIQDSEGNQNLCVAWGSGGGYCSTGETTEVYQGSLPLQVHVLSAAPGGLHGGVQGGGGSSGGGGGSQDAGAGRRADGAPKPQRRGRDLGFIGNRIRGIFVEGLGKELFERYWLGDATEYRLTSAQFTMISDAVAGLQPLGVWKVGDGSYERRMFTMPRGELFDSFGTALVFYDQAGVPIGFYDRYNFDVKPQGEGLRNAAMRAVKKACAEAGAPCVPYEVTFGWYVRP